MLLRHAKSDWSAVYGADHERPLNKRGTRAARAVGVAVARSGEIPNYAITSSATRALSTLELASDAGGWHTEVVVSPALYSSSSTGVLEVAASAPDTAQRVMLVGHEPTWGAVVEVLTGARVTVKTATLMVVDLYASSWVEAPKARGSIAYVFQPRLFTDGSWDITPG